MINRSEINDGLRRVSEEGRLSKQGSSDVCAEVYAVFEHCQQGYAGWHESSNLSKQYYRGEQDKNKRIAKFRTRINDPESFSLVDNMLPAILERIGDYDILAVNEDQIDAARMLSNRVIYAKKICYWNQQVTRLISDILKEGRGVIKLQPSVGAYRIDPRRVMRQIESDSMDSAHYVMDVTLQPKWKIVNRFKRKGLDGNFDILDSKVGEPKGAYVSDTSMTVNAAAPGTESPRFRYELGLGSTDPFQTAQQIMTIELWIHDQTMISSKLKYPFGRIVTVGVGKTSDGSVVSNGNNLDIQTLYDRPNTFSSLYERTKSPETGYGRFLFSEFLWENTGDIGSTTPIHEIIGLQNALNMAWIQLIDNMRLVNSPRRYIKASAGITSGTLTNEAGETVNLPQSASAEPFSNLLYTDQIPPFAAQSIGIISTIKVEMRNALGITDVARGEIPGSVTAASAINLLQRKSENRISLRAKSIELELGKVTENLAYLSQDVDDGEMMFPDESKTNEESYVTYNPEMTRNIGIRIIAAEKIPLNEQVEVIGAVMSAEQVMPGAGELILVDPRYQLSLKMYKNVQKAQADAMAQEQERQVESVMAQTLTQKAMAMEHENGRTTK